MIVSNEYDGPYANSRGYKCNDCGSPGAGERWLCMRCSNDYCFACRKLSRPTPSLKSGLFWNARASILTLVLTVVERVLCDEGEPPIVEMRAMLQSLVESIAEWVACKDQDMDVELGKISSSLTCRPVSPSELGFLFNHESPTA